MNYTNSYLKIEFIKAKKNISLFIFLFTLLFISMILTFILHLQRVGLSGNQNIPLNYSYGGYAFSICFYLSLIIFTIFVDSDIRDEIKSNKINILFTQSSKRISYYFGKVFFWTIFLFLVSVFLTTICWLLSSKLIFANRPPRLSDNSVFPLSYIILNLITQLVLLLPSILFFINLSFISGFFFYSSAAGILFNIFVVIFSIQLKSLILYPLNKMAFPIQPISLPKIFDNKSLRSLLTVIFFNILFYFIVKSFISKREFR